MMRCLPAKRAGPLAIEVQIDGERVEVRIEPGPNGWAGELGQWNVYAAFGRHDVLVQPRFPRPGLGFRTALLGVWPADLPVGRRIRIRRLPVTAVARWPGARPATLTYGSTRLRARRVLATTDVASRRLTIERMAAGGRGTAVQRRVGELLTAHDLGALDVALAEGAPAGVVAMLRRCRLKTALQRLAARLDGESVRCGHRMAWLRPGRRQTLLLELVGGQVLAAWGRHKFPLGDAGYVVALPAFELGVADGDAPRVRALALQVGWTNEVSTRRMVSALRERGSYARSEPGGWWRCGDLRVALERTGDVTIERTGGPDAAWSTEPMAVSPERVADIVHHLGRDGCVRCAGRRVSGLACPCPACTPPPPPKVRPKPARPPVPAAAAKASPAASDPSDVSLVEFAPLLEVGQIGTAMVDDGRHIGQMVRGYTWTIAPPAEAVSNTLWRPALAEPRRMVIEFCRAAAHPSERPSWRISWSNGLGYASYPCGRSPVFALLRLRAWLFGVEGASLPPPLDDHNLAGEGPADPARHARACWSRVLQAIGAALPRFTLAIADGRRRWAEAHAETGPAIPLPAPGGMASTGDGIAAAEARAPSPLVLPAPGDETPSRRDRQVERLAELLARHRPGLRLVPIEMGGRTRYTARDDARPWSLSTRSPLAAVAWALMFAPAPVEVETGPPIPLPAPGRLSSELRRSNCGTIDIEELCGGIAIDGGFRTPAVRQAPAIIIPPAPSTPIPSLFPRYGSQDRVCAKLPAPEHPTIAEPFAGGAAYARRYPNHQVVLVDRDPTVVETWRYLIAAEPADILALPDMLSMPSGTTTDDLDVPEGARYLIGFWIRRGAVRPRRTPSKWALSGRWPRQFWGRYIRERIAAAVPRLKHWQVVDGDFAATPVEGPATWVFDPPWQGGEGAGRRYAYQLDAYGRLADYATTREGQVIVLEGEGATWLPFKPLAGGSTSTLFGRRKTLPVWWYRGEGEVPEPPPPRPPPEPPPEVQAAPAGPARELLAAWLDLDPSTGRPPKVRRERVYELRHQLLEQGRPAHDQAIAREASRVFETRMSREAVWRAHDVARVRLERIVDDLGRDVVLAGLNDLGWAPRWSA